MEAESLAAWVGALGGLSGFLALGGTWIAGRKRRRLPDPALRPLLEALIYDYNDLVSAGGQPTPWFLEVGRQKRDLALASLHGAVVDDDLNQLIGEARGAYQDCFAFSSPSRVPAHVDKQLEFASAGRTATSEAIERMNQLLRKHGHLR